MTKGFLVFKPKGTDYKSVPAENTCAPFILNSPFSILHSRNPPTWWFQSSEYFPFW